MVKTFIEEGDNVIFKREESSRIYQIRKNRMVHFSKTKFSVEELIGQPYGSSFELDRGRLTRIEQTTDETTVGATSLDQSADNRNLHDTEKNQKMSKEDIMKMKDEGITGEKIIEELVENSETFKTKTEFSQAKYLKKKKKRHMLVFTVHQPTPRLIMEMYAKEPGKLNYLRPDSLSQLLCFSNVMYGSRVAVMESCQGMVVASILQRVGDAGKLVQLIPNTQNPPTRNIVDYFSFPKEHLNNLYTFPLDHLAALPGQTDDDSGEEMAQTDQCQESVSIESTNSNGQGGVEEQKSSGVVKKTPNGETVETSTEGSGSVDKSESSEVPDSTSDAPKSSQIDEAADDVKSEVSQSEANSDKDTKPFVKNRDLQRMARAKRLKEAGHFLKHKQLDSLVIACKQNPLPVLSNMLNFLGPSRAVVVYSQYLDPLVECYTYVKEHHVGIQLRLTDTWLRKYQVLPQRTHPTVNMSGTGGYLLTFLTTEPSPYH